MSDLYKFQPIRPLVCGMSRSGSTLLTKILVELLRQIRSKPGGGTFRSYKRPLVEKKLFKNEFKVNGHRADGTVWSIIKIHKWETERFPDDWPTHIFLCKRDLRDATYSNMISHTSPWAASQ